jgi:hypothetical protein
MVSLSKLSNRPTLGINQHGTKTATRVSELDSKLLAILIIGVGERGRVMW